MPDKSTILIVDDQMSAREVLRGLLAGPDYNLVTTKTGGEALAQATKLRPDLILLDVMMPEMDGYEVCRRVRADPLLSSIPVIMITALDDPASLIKGIEAGADDFISKPFNPLELRARVRTITSLNRYRRLLAEQTKFDWVVQRAEDGYLIIDRRDAILYANTQARLYLGLPAHQDEAIVAGFIQLVSQQYQLEPEQAWTIWPEQSDALDRAPRYLVRPESPNANTVWLQVDTLELPVGPVQGWLIHLRDVTGQVALRRNAWEFQAIVSHKLRTPLGSIINGLALLEDEGVKKLLDPEMGEIFEIVLNGAKRLERDIQRVLQYIHISPLAPPDAGFKLVQLQPLVARISAEIGLSQVTLSSQPELDLCQLSLSEQSIELILRELLGNAQKFHPQHEPAIEITAVCLKHRAGNGQFSLQIKDDGLTLAPEQLARAWTPYYQADKYFTGEVAGIGLGLSKVALLIWSIGGKCYLYNRQDRPGVVVELRLPLRN
jgi:DNA-binding response OmpR family regulator